MCENIEKNDVDNSVGGSVAMGQLPIGRSAPIIPVRSSDTPAISLDDVTMRYPLPRRYVDYLRFRFDRKSCVALRNVNWSLPSGGRMCVVGANGAGKTTLLKLIGGLIYPTQGQIEINGICTQKHNLAARMNIGYVLNDERSFYWRLSGRQNLEFFGALNDLSGQQLRRRVDETLGHVGLENSADQRVSNYSAGMRQRLAIARSLLHNPEILILDEPTRTLDPLGAHKLRLLIRDAMIDQPGRTLVLATHHLSEAEMLCDTVCVMKAGSVVAFKDMASIYEEVGDLETYYRQLYAEELVTADV